ncbi:MAG: DoxX family membrane protein [Oceanipulchritudo sp.]
MKSNPTHLITIALRIGLAGLFAAAAFGKFKGMDDSVSLFESLGMEPAGRYLIGSLEALAALLILFPLTVTTGALLGWGIMSGALLAHFTKIGIAGPMLPLTLSAFTAWVASLALLFLRRDQIGFIKHMFDCGKE